MTNGTSTARVKASASRHGGQVLVDQLVLHGATRVFCVPGESYLAALDGLFDAGIDIVNARQEGGATMMADADGKLTGRPGIAFVTRGPGATNAASGVHVAFQDSTPMVLFIGQVASDQRDREAFQEVDYRAMFAPLAKAVYELERTDRIPEYVARAFHVASNGRPGPVVVALPEDRLSAAVTVRDAQPFARVHQGVSAAVIDELVERIGEAERPLAIVGGGGWSARAAADLARFANAHAVPVGAAFRCQDYLDNRDPAYVGHVGIGPDPRLAARVRECDLLIVLGARLGEMTTSGYTLVDVPTPEQALVHVHADADEPGRVYTPTLGIAAHAPELVAALAERATPTVSASRRGWLEQGRADYLDWLRPRDVPAPLSLERVIAHLDATLDDTAILCNGAGNYGGWLHRFYRFRGWRTQLAPTSGSMGYGLPAAIAAALRHPERQVVCLAGDGCFQMTLQELAVAAERGCRLLVIVCDNAAYGTIRMHQERQYPGRVSGTALVNPDFAALARSYGAAGEAVTTDAQFVEAFDRWRQEPGLALLHLGLAGTALTPAR